MTNSNTSILIVGIVAAALLCGTAVAVIAISSNTNDMSQEQKDFYEGYRDGYNEATRSNVQLTASNDKGEYLTMNKLMSQVPQKEDVVLVDCLGVCEVDSRSDAYWAGYNAGYSDGSEGINNVSEAYIVYKNTPRLKSGFVRADLETVPAE